MSNLAGLGAALVELRQAAENEVVMLEKALAPQPLTSFEKDLIRCAFKGGASWSLAKHGPKTEATSQ